MKARVYCKTQPTFRDVRMWKNVRLRIDDRQQQWDQTAFYLGVSILEVRIFLTQCSVKFSVFILFCFPLLASPHRENTNSGIFACFLKNLLLLTQTIDHSCEDWLETAVGDCFSQDIGSLPCAWGCVCAAQVRLLSPEMCVSVNHRGCSLFANVVLNQVLNPWYPLLPSQSCHLDSNTCLSSHLPLVLCHYSPSCQSLFLDWYSGNESPMSGNRPPNL